MRLRKERKDEKLRLAEKNKVRMHRNVLLNSLKDTLLIIKSHKLAVILLCLFQLAVIFGFFVTSYAFINPIVEREKEIDPYLSNLRLDETSVGENILGRKNILGEDPLLISRNTRIMSEHFMSYLISLFFLLVLSTAISWSVSINMMKRVALSDFARIFMRILLMSSIFYGLVFSLLYFIGPYLFLVIISIVLLYFFLISLSLCSSEIKTIPKKTLNIGFKKARYILLVHLINGALLSIFLTALIFFVDRVLIMILSVLLISLGMIFSRNFLAKTIEELSSSQ